MIHTDGKPTIANAPRASRKAGQPVRLEAELKAGAMVSAEEIEQAMRDAQDLMAKANRMLGWSHLLPEQAVEGLRVGRDMADAVYVGLRNAFQEATQADPLDTTGSASRQHYIDTGRYLRMSDRND